MSSAASSVPTCSPAPPSRPWASGREAAGAPLPPPPGGHTGSGVAHGRGRRPRPAPSSRRTPSRLVSARSGTLSVLRRCEPRTEPRTEPWYGSAAFAFERSSESRKPPVSTRFGVSAWRAAGGPALLGVALRRVEVGPWRRCLVRGATLPSTAAPPGEGGAKNERDAACLQPGMYRLGMRLSLCALVRADSGCRDDDPEGRPLRHDIWGDVGRYGEGRPLWRGTEPRV